MRSNSCHAVSADSQHSGTDLMASEGAELILAPSLLRKLRDEKIEKVDHSKGLRLDQEACNDKNDVSERDCNAAKKRARR